MAYRGGESARLATEGHPVLYLLEPSLVVLCNRESGSAEALDQARADPHLDLADLRWDRVPQPVDGELLLTLALIHGTPCSRGIVIDGAMVGILDRGRLHSREYRKTEPGHARSAAHQHAVDEWLGIPPSLVLQRQAVADRIATQQAEDQRKAEAQASKLLAGALSTALLRHWITLGGPEPD